MSVQDKGWTWIWGRSWALGDFCCQVRNLRDGSHENSAREVMEQRKLITVRRITSFNVVAGKPNEMKYQPVPWIAKNFNIIDDETECLMATDHILYLSKPTERLIQSVREAWIEGTITPADEKMQAAVEASARAAARMKGDSDRAKRKLIFPGADR